MIENNKMNPVSRPTPYAASKTGLNPISSGWKNEIVANIATAAVTITNKLLSNLEKCL
jgi:hypothetical protein